MIEPTGDERKIEGSEKSAPGASSAPPLRSVHTSSFAQLLTQLGVSVAVSTYQAGKLIFLRSDGKTINTHFRNFNRPMGIASGGGRLAIGTQTEVWEFHDVPAVCSKLDRKADGTPSHDACYLPRSVHFAGGIQVHEMVWAGPGRDELWLVNTRYSCLCTTSLRYSFVPRWRPPFVTHLAPEDRCHLNGLGLRDDQPRYVTALGRCNTPGAWRENKKSGGIVMDIANNELLCTGLSMPHSPRWHEGRLWVLQSGEGQLGFVDPTTARYEVVATLPGFTRGLDFAGPYAFVGLSQVRETATFSGISIANRPADQRSCGVWVVDLRTGQTAAYVKFMDAVQEIFSVQVLTGSRWPDLINDDPEILAQSFVLPDEALRELDPDLNVLRAGGIDLP